MGAKKTTKPKRSKAKARQASTNVSPTLWMMAGRNLINMVVVGVTSGAVLLTLLAVKHF